MAEIRVRSKSMKKWLNRKSSDTDRSRNSINKWFDKKSTIACAECDGKNVSKCAAIHRIGCILSHYEKWLKLKQKEQKYGMYEFIHSGLKATKEKDVDTAATENNEARFNYSSVKLLDDYHHILYDHNTEENSLEAVYEYLLSTYLSSTVCKARKCKLLSRNHRNRWLLSVDNNKRIKCYSGNDVSHQVYTMKLCDRIHSTLLHSFDCGYKLSQKDRDLISKKTAQLSVNERLKYVHDVIIKPKRKRICKIRGNQRFNNNKFISFYNPNELEMKLQDENIDTDSDSESSNSHHSDLETISESKEMEETTAKATQHTFIEYGFGVAYKYWPSYSSNEWFVAPKHKHLRTEIVNNNTHAISMNQFNDELKNVIDLIHCKRGKALTCKVWNESIGIEQNSAITIDHLLCLVFISNYDHLRRKLMATFKKKDENESNEALIARHSEFYHLGRLSFELIHLFGINGDDAKDADLNVWYHGFDEQVIFHDTFLKFECITSTTSNLHVALSYACANGNGLILTLKQVHCRYFDCRWLSDYSNEDESVFVQNEFKLHSILNISRGLFADYEWYLNVLTIMKMMFNGMFLNDAKLALNEDICSFVSQLVDHCDEITENINVQNSRKRQKSIFNKMQKEEEEKWIQPYVAALFKQYLKDKNGLIINIWAMNMDEFKMRDQEDITTTCFGYKLMRDLFMDTQQDWIYFAKLTRLYPSAELICIYSVDWMKGNNLPTIKLNDNFANKLLSFLSLDSSSLIDIWIYSPNEDECQMTQFISKYEEMFAYIKWKPTMQQKQIPGLKDKLGDIKTLCITYEGQAKNDDGGDDEEDDDDDDDDSDSY